MNPQLTAIWEALSQVVDPEIPVVSLVEMGIVRSIAWEGDTLVVAIAPTFSGCPALEVMKRDIAASLEELGYIRSRVDVSLSPPWTTDWITESGREKLQAFGISPPEKHSGEVLSVLLNPVECPYCGSMATTMQNGFGPTPCRMIFTCENCKQPFESFKPL